MKIYFLILNIYGMGGTVRTVLNTANYLAEKDYEIEIISVFRKQRKPFFEINPKINVTVIHDLYKRKKNQKGIRGLLINKLEKMKSYLIHKDEEAHEQFSLLTDIKLYLYIKSLKNCVLVSTRPCFNLLVAQFANKSVTTIGQEHINFEGHPPALKKSITKHYPKLNYLITLTEKDKANYKKIFKNDKLNILKIPNSIGEGTRLKSPLTNKTVIAAGRLDYVKGFDLLIEAFSLVVEKHPDWNLRIYGQGREKNNLLKLIQERHLYNNVFLMGPTKQLEQKLQESSIYVLSSRLEGFGMVLVESMQCGVPIVSFDCPYGPSEIITNYEDGILVENGNIEQLGEKINYLIENEKLRIKMGEFAYRNVKRFSIDKIGKVWDDFFKRINIRNQGQF